MINTPQSGFVKLQTDAIVNQSTPERPTADNPDSASFAGAMRQVLSGVAPARNEAVPSRRLNGKDLAGDGRNSRTPAPALTAKRTDAAVTGQELTATAWTAENTESSATPPESDNPKPIQEAPEAGKRRDSAESAPANCMAWFVPPPLEIPSEKIAGPVPAPEGRFDGSAPPDGTAPETETATVSTGDANLVPNPEVESNRSGVPLESASRRSSATEGREREEKDGAGREVPFKETEAVSSETLAGLSENEPQPSLSGETPAPNAGNSSQLPRGLSKNQEPPRERPPAAPGGMPDAQSNAPMKKADEMNQIAARAEQKLPPGADTRTAKDVSVPAAVGRQDTETASGVLSNMAHRTGGPNQVETTAPDAPALPTPATDRAALMDKISQLVTQRVLELKQVGASAMTAVLRPDAGTELHLQLELRQGVVEVRARCDLGDRNALGANWSQIQQSLAQQGIRVHPLNEAPPRQTDAGPFAGQPDANTGSTPDRNGARRSPQAALPEEPSSITTPLNRRRTPNRPSFTRLAGQRWESWA